MFNSYSTPLFKYINFKKIILLSFFGVLISTISFAQSNNSGKLIIKVNEIRNQKGKVRVSIYNSSNGFPDSPDKAKYLAEGVIIKNSSIIVLKNMPYGYYAVSLIHDENMNGKLETNFLGIPKEGFGMSNDAKGFMGPPEFEQAKFKFKKNNQTIQIKMDYY